MSLLSLTVNGVSDALISPLDRGLGYGDGLFETCRCVQGAIPFWRYHRDRLLKSATRLGFAIDWPALDDWLNQSLTCHRAESHTVVKIQITRGIGGRGYRIPAQASPNYVIAVFAGTSLETPAFIEGVDVRMCSTRLGKNPTLAGIKHLNRLEQVMARSEWQDEYGEGLLLDTDGNIIEATASNIFLVKAGELFTPDLSYAGVAGVMRRIVLDVFAPEFNIPVQIKNLSINDLAQADEIFLTNSVFGIWPVISVAGISQATSSTHNVTRILQQALSARVNAREAL